MELEPRPGEIWADAEGTLMVCATRGGWWVFGVESEIDESDPDIVQPVRLVFDLDGLYRGPSDGIYA